MSDQMLTNTSDYAILLREIGSLRIAAGLAHAPFTFGFATSRRDSTAAQIMHSDSALAQLSQDLGGMFAWRLGSWRHDVTTLDDEVTLVVNAAPN
jgi:hypothetical protein